MKGAIAAGHPMTAAAAEEILQDGGNAFDAIVAAHFCACVVEPVLASLAGGGYMLAQKEGADPICTTSSYKPLDQEIQKPHLISSLFMLILARYYRNFI